MFWRFPRVGWLLATFACIGVACGGHSTAELTVVNTLQSTEPIRVDLGGEVRTLDIGDITIFRSVAYGQHVLSIESTFCAGTTRDTLTVNSDLTVRYLATQNLTSGECQIESTVNATRPASPISNYQDEDGYPLSRV